MTFTASGLTIRSPSTRLFRFLVLLFGDGGSAVTVVTDLGED